MAITAASHGLRTLVLERAKLPVDKACGEGLMPSGVRVLQRLGAWERLDSAEMSLIDGIRYIDPEGRVVEGRLPTQALGIRRPALARALLDQAVERGAEVRDEDKVERCERVDAGVLVHTAKESHRARVLVAADGLLSPLRTWAGLNLGPVRGRRYGMRQHFLVAPWTSHVEVHLASGLEAYVTPCGPQRVGLAFLWRQGALAAPVNVAQLLRRFPLLVERFRDAVPCSEVRGAGPFRQRASAQVAPRLMLVGDAAGYVDAITGEGLSLALESALSLGEVLPAAVESDGNVSALAPYQRAFRRLFRHYALGAQLTLWLAHHERLRAALLTYLQKNPQRFEQLLKFAVGMPSTGQRTFPHLAAHR